MGNFVRIAVGLFAASLLVACGGGGGGGGGAGSDTSAESVRTALATSNISSAGYPWSVVVSTPTTQTLYFAPPGILKRWELPIPVKTKDDARVVSALNEIERQLGKTIFDRTSIAATPDGSVTRGLVASIGTHLVIGGGTICAAPSSVPGTTQWPNPIATSGGVMSNRLYLNVDAGTCRADVNMVIDAIATAMGMASYYPGRYAESDGIVLSALFWRVLQTMYANPPGTPQAAITVP